MVNLKTYLKRFVRNGPALVPIKSIKCFFECLDLVTSVKRHFWNLEKANDELLSCCSPTEPLVATEAPSRHLNLLPIQSSSVAVSCLWKILWNHFPSFDFHNMGLGPWKLDIFIFNILLVQKLFQDSSFSVIVLFEEKMGFILWLILRRGALSSFFVICDIVSFSSVVMFHK